MSWAEIKKAINNDISQPLSTRVSGWINSAVSTLKSYISTGGNVKVVRNVQRGTAAATRSAYADTVNITLTGFSNVNKMVVILDSAKTASISSSYDNQWDVLVNSLSTTTLSIYFGYDHQSMNCSYQVIEYY